MSKQAFIFRGAPASGKGTLVPEFCKTVESPVALIEQDNFRWGIHLFGRDIADITDAEHQLAYRATVATYEQYLKSGLHTVVVEGLFTWNNTESSQGNAKELIDLAEQYGYEATSIVLKAAKNELLKRNAEREYSVPIEEFEALYDGVYSTVDQSEVVIDSTGLDLPQTLQALASELSQSN